MNERLTNRKTQESEGKVSEGKVSDKIKIKAIAEKTRKKEIYEIESKDKVKKKGSKYDFCKEWWKLKDFFDEVKEYIRIFFTIIKYGIGKDKKEESTSENGVDIYQSLTNLLKIPIEIERFFIFGNLIYFSTFLSIFSFIPLRLIFFCIQKIKIEIGDFFQGKRLKNCEYNCISNSLQRDMLILILIFFTVTFLFFPLFNISKLYHDIKGEEFFKLYFMIGFLDVFEKLCSSLGSNIVKILFNTIGSQKKTGETKINSIIVFCLSFSYLCLHTYIIIYKTVSLNIVVNSNFNFFFSVFVSSQFSEFKSLVFKKFDVDGILTILITDLNKRFQLAITLIIIGSRNFMQLLENSSIFDHGNLKDYFRLIIFPTIFIFKVKVVVDWLKYSFISKYNKISYAEYQNFLKKMNFCLLQNISKSNFFTVLKFDFLINDSYNTSDLYLSVLPYVICFLRVTLPYLKDFLLLSLNLTKRNLIIKSLFTFLIIYTFIVFVTSILILITLLYSLKIKKVKINSKTFFDEFFNDEKLTNKKC